MGKCDITYACGHAGEERITGSRWERDRLLWWIENKKLCRECYLKEKDTKGPEVYARRTQQGAEIYLLNSYNVREELKARGYRFGEYSRGVGALDLMSPLSNGWGRIFTPDQKAALADEIAWIEERGWKIQAVDLLHGVFLQPIAEGRPDLLPVVANRRET